MWFSNTSSVLTPAPPTTCFNDMRWYWFGMLMSPDSFCALARVLNGVWLHKTNIHSLHTQANTHLNIQKQLLRWSFNARGNKHTELIMQIQRNHYSNQRKTSVCIHWTGLLDWPIGLTLEMTFEFFFFNVKNCCSLAS